MKYSTAVLGLAGSMAAASPVNLTTDNAVNTTNTITINNTTDFTNLMAAGFPETVYGADFPAVALAAHNAIRAKHGAPPLVWNADLARYAGQLAGTCVLAHDTAIGAETGNYGQNLGSTGTSATIEPKDPGFWIQDHINGQWYTGEINKFPGYGQPHPDLSAFPQWGHYTQLIWAGTTEVGCAVQFCPNGAMARIPGMETVLSACNYRVPGNIPGQFVENVKPPQ